MAAQKPDSWRFLIRKGARSWGIKKRDGQQGVVYNRGGKERSMDRCTETKKQKRKRQRDTRGQNKEGIGERQT